MSVPRPLPPVPNLEFARKEAKLLLRQLRAGEAHALARAQASHSAVAQIAPSEFKLADAQLTIAREYGFASWPRLARYFNTAERQRYRTHSNPGSLDGYEYYARALLASHAKRQTRAGRTLAEYVPRFFGVPLADVFDASVTEDEARHAFARDAGFSSWAALIEKTTESKAQANEGWNDAWHVDVRQLAVRVVHARDLAALQQLVREHPDLLQPKDYQTAQNDGLLNWALGGERQFGQDAMRPIMDWLASLGFDAARRMNEQLCGRMHMTVDEVQSLLDRGADPNWIAPNGLSVLEHALIRYWNGECVDLIAARATPRRALWIAAGLGDVAGVSRFLDRYGKPTAAARANRPDFTAVGPFSMPSPFAATDEEILTEAFLVAAFNSRVAVLEYLVSRGFPVNSVAVIESPVVQIAAGNGWTAVVECLVRCGADVDLPGESNGSARELARELLSQRPADRNRRRIAELCGVDVAAFLAERDAQSSPMPTMGPDLITALALASDDARRLGQSVVGVEHLLFGLLRAGQRPQYYFTRASRMDFLRFREKFIGRVHFGDERVDGVELPRSVETQAIVADATALAVTRRHDIVTGMHLLAAIVRAGGAATALLERFDGNVEELNTSLDDAMSYHNAG